MRSIAATFGVSEDRIESGTRAQQIRQIHTEAALFATGNILTWTEQFVQSTAKKLMVILSFSGGNIVNELAGKPRFDQSFVEWLRSKTYPVIDMRDVFAGEYEQSKADSGLRWPLETLRYARNRMPYNPPWSCSMITTSP